MPIQRRARDQDRYEVPPSESSEKEKAAIRRALLNEDVTDFCRRLQQENNRYRAIEAARLLDQMQQPDRRRDPSAHTEYGLNLHHRAHLDNAAARMECRSVGKGTDRPISNGA